MGGPLEGAGGLVGVAVGGFVGGLVGGVVGGFLGVVASLCLGDGGQSPPTPTARALPPMGEIKSIKRG